jgi:hypothetical protein
MYRILPSQTALTVVYAVLCVLLDLQPHMTEAEHDDIYAKGLAYLQSGADGCKKCTNPRKVLL